MALPNSGTLSYNGRTFVSLYKSKVDVKPVKDSAGRALVAREYTLDVEGYVVASAITMSGGNAGQLSTTTDLAMSDLRIALEKPGAPPGLPRQVAMLNESAVRRVRTAQGGD